MATKGITNKEQIWNERKEFAIDFLKSAVIGLIIIFVALGIKAASGMMMDQWQSGLDRKTAEVNNLSGALMRSMAEIQEKQLQVKTTSTGFNVERKALDDEIFDEFMEFFMTWDGLVDESAATTSSASSANAANVTFDGRTYSTSKRDATNRRLTVMCMYDESFKKDGISEYYDFWTVVTTDVEGNGRNRYINNEGYILPEYRRYDRVSIFSDEERTKVREAYQEYKGMRSYVASMYAGTYHYLAVVDTELYIEGLVDEERSFVVGYQIDEDNTMHDMYAYRIA